MPPGWFAEYEHISIFALNEHILTWTRFSFFLRCFVQSYLCAWCNAMGLQPSCLKASPPHPDIRAVAWLFFQPLSPLLIFIRSPFCRDCLIPCLFLSPSLKIVLQGWGVGVWRNKGWLWLKKGEHIYIYLPADAAITLKADCEEKKGLWYKANMQWIPKGWHPCLKWTALHGEHLK